MTSLTDSSDLQDQPESSSIDEERDYFYGMGPRDESGHEEGTADHQDRIWYYGEGEVRNERKKRGVVHRYVDMDKPAGEKTTKQGGKNASRRDAASFWEREGRQHLNTTSLCSRYTLWQQPLSVGCMRFVRTMRTDSSA